MQTFSRNSDGRMIERRHTFRVSRDRSSSRPELAIEPQLPATLPRIHASFRNNTLTSWWQYSGKADVGVGREEKRLNDLRLKLSKNSLQPNPSQQVKSKPLSQDMHRDARLLQFLLIVAAAIQRDDADGVTLCCQ